jgi:hypothetical protein
MLEKLDKRTSVSQQVASFSIIFLSSSGGNLPFLARQKQARITQKKHDFHTMRAKIAGRKKEAEAKEQCDREEEA